MYDFLYNKFVFNKMINTLSFLTLNGKKRFFLSHFLYVKDKEPKLQDFLSMSMSKNIFDINKAFNL